MEKNKSLDFEFGLLLHVGFRIEKLQRIGFFNEIFSTCQIFFWKKNASVSEFEISEMSDLKKVCIQKITLPSFTPCIRQLLRFSCFSFDHISEKNSYHTSDFEMKRIKRVKVWVKENNASDSNLKVLQRVRFWIENFATCQILNWRKIQRVRFWNKRNYSPYFEIDKNHKALEFDIKLLLDVRCGIGKLQRFIF